MWDMQREPTEDRTTPPTAKDLRDVRGQGVLLLVIGLIVLYFRLFGEPAKDPLLF
jgi:hypothetical protein